MFLKKLHLKNIRCFKDLRVDFVRPEGAPRRRGRSGDNRKWTIVLGENGAGKTTLLRAAALITSGSRALTELLGEPKDWVRQGAARGSIAAVIETQAGEERELSLEIRRRDEIHDVISRAAVSLAPLDDALAHTERNYFVAAYGSSRRLASEKKLGLARSPFRSARAQAVATLFDTEAALNPIEAWAMQLDYEKGKQGLAVVSKAINSFMRGVTFARIDKRSGQLFFKTPDGTLPLSALSDGYQNVAAWVGDLLFRVHQTFEDYEEPLKTRGLLIVDEIDLHLHPRWQRRLHQYLQTKLPNMQLLVTTHSAVTAQQADGHELHYLKRRGKTVNIHEFEVDPSNLLVGQLLLSEAFGLDSEGSERFEKRRTRYRSLRDKDNLSRREEGELENLKAEIESSLEQRAPDRLGIPDSEIERLRALQTAIKSKRK